jgi:enoyl-CoA hydratase
VIAEIASPSRSVWNGPRACHALVLTGAGEKAFVAGADIAEMATCDLEARAPSRGQGHALGERSRTLPFPIIAAVNGFALGGGCELALACDLIYASDKAKFGQPEVTLGVIPGFGGTQRLARRVGVGKARELVFTGVMIDAAEALRIGLVNKVFAPDQLLEAARNTAKTIAAMGPLAIAEAKKVMREGEGRLLKDANALEIEGFAGCFETEDQKEGMQAFLERRSPSFGRA